MNSHTCKDVDQRLANIAHLKRMAAGKALTLSQEANTKLDNHEKFLKYLKKQNKEQKLSQVEIGIFCRGVFEEIDELLRVCYFSFRLEKTDFESLFIKLRFNEEGKKKGKIDLQEIISFQTKKQGDILLKCKDNLLMQLRNDIQDFQLCTLIKKSTQILQTLPFTSTLSARQQQTIAPLITEIAKNYNIMPFHNFTHGFGVFMSFFCLAQQVDAIRGLLDQGEMFFCLVACLAHDLQHQGVNTLFQVKVNSQLSGAFGKFAVMEKMHLSKTLDILIRKDQTNKLFEALTPEHQTKARKIISKSILATDMSKHYAYVSAITEKTLDPSSPEDKELAIEALVHACDIENPSLDFKSYMYWAHLVCMEFHDQTVREKEACVEVTDFLKFDSLLYFFKNQSNFASTIVYPLWSALEKLFPELEEKEYSKRIKKNIGILSEALRRNSEPVLLHKPFQQYLTNRLQI